jgi:RND family efflux transporter MFP subunit
LIFGVRWLAAHKGAQEQGMKRGGAVAIEVALVETGVIRDIGEFTGSLRAESRIVVAPKVGGRIEKLHVRLGDTVRNGQLLAELDSGTYQQQLEQAKADLMVAQAQVEDTRGALKTASNDFEAGKTMLGNQYISQSDLELLESKFLTAKSKYDIAQAQVQRNTAAVRLAEIQLGYTRITASWSDGAATRVVGEVSAEEGALLTANTPIVTILDNSRLIARIDIAERDYSWVRIGQEVEAGSDIFPGRKFRGTVARIAPQLDEASRQAAVEIDIPNPDGALRPGMYVRIAIEYARHEGATMVPIAALAQQKGSTVVYVVDRKQSKVAAVKVKTGIREGDRVEIIEPPMVGEVATVGREQLDDGRPVKLPGSGNAQRGPRP